MPKMAVSGVGPIEGAGIRGAFIAGSEVVVVRVVNKRDSAGNEVQEALVSCPVWDIREPGQPADSTADVKKVWVPISYLVQ